MKLRPVRSSHCRRHPFWAAFVQADAAVNGIDLLGCGGTVARLRQRQLLAQTPLLRLHQDEPLAQAVSFVPEPVDLTDDVGNKCLLRKYRKRSVHEGMADRAKNRLHAFSPRTT